MYKPTERLALQIHSWQVNANIFKVMRNSLLRDFYLVSLSFVALCCYFKTNIQNFFVLVYFVCHTPQFTMLVFAFQSEIWIVQNFNLTVFQDFCLSLSWKYRFLQNVNHAYKFNPKPISIANFTLI